MLKLKQTFLSTFKLNKSISNFQENITEENSGALPIPRNLGNPDTSCSINLINT